jgi:hypothetical protein
VSTKTVARPKWCGRCDERTRQFNLSDGRVGRCQDCHPLRITPTGEQLMRQGMARALEGAAEDYKAAFRAEVYRRIDAGERFTSEDIIAVVGLPSGAVGLNNNNAIGSLIGWFVRKELIKEVDRVKAQRPNSHGARISLWAGAQ